MPKVIYLTKDGKDTQYDHVTEANTVDGTLAFVTRSGTIHIVPLHAFDEAVISDEEE